MKQVNIYEDFILGHHNLKEGKYGYLSVTRLTIDFNRPVMGNKVLAIRIVRSKDITTDNDYFLIGHLENKFHNSGFKLTEEQFQKACQFLEQGQGEALHTYCVELANKNVRSPMQEMEDD